MKEKKEEKKKRKENQNEEKSKNLNKTYSLLTERPEQDKKNFEEKLGWNLPRCQLVGSLLGLGRSRLLYLV